MQIIFKLKHFIDISFSSKGLGFTILRSDDICQSIIICNHKGGYLRFQKCILFQNLEKRISFVAIFLFEIVIRDGKIDEKLVGISPFSDDEMPKETLMRHLIMDGQPRIFTQSFEMFENFISFIRDKSTAIDIDNLAKFSLFMKSYASI